MDKPLKHHPSFMLDTVEVDTVALASQGNAVLGIRDSGKTVTAEKLAEEMYAAGIPFVAFDPIGVWRYLRVPGTGRGIPVVVAGGEAGDLPLSPATAPEIMRAAMKAGVSLVFDLHDINLSKADWKRVVADSVRVLVYENGPHGLRHVFLEEAAEFVPQRVGPDSGVVYAEIEKMARMGGNARLGYTLINQRAEEVNKSVLELCDNLFLHRQKGRHSITALSKWLYAGAVVDHRAITDSLSTLPTGECWAWMAQSEVPVRIKVPMKDSFHPDRRILMDAMAVATKFKPVDAGEFVASMKALLKPLEPPAPAPPQPAAASRKAPTAPPGVDLEAIRREAKQAGHVEGYRLGHDEGYRVATVVATEMMQRALESIRPTPPTADDLALRAHLVGIGEEMAREPERPAPPKKPERRVAAAEDGALRGAAATLMDAISRYADVGLTWGEACIVAGMIPGNGYFYGGRKTLQNGAHVYDRDGKVFPHAPTRAVGHATKAELKAIWAKLKTPAPRIFGALCDAGGAWVDLARLAATLELKPGNGFWYGGFSALRGAGLIEQEKDRARLVKLIGDAK